MKRNATDPERTRTRAGRGRVSDKGSYDFRVCKLCGAPAGRPVYTLRDSTLWICSECAAPYIDYLDPVEPGSHEPAPAHLTQKDRDYFEKTQHHSTERLDAHVALVKRYRECSELRMLDVGSGGGLFLKTVRDAGAIVCGSEPAAKSAAYSRETYGLEVYANPVEDEFWQDGYRETFDVVTMWDVIEHVNFPRETIQSVANLLKCGGLLMVGTPCREGFYHRFGSATAKLSCGRYPTLLSIMYSGSPYAHKQILSVRDLERLFGYAGLKTVRTDIVMELSLPCAHYMRKILRSERLARVTAPFAKTAFSVFKVRNKMISVAEKLP
jgi:2-polyprenyl-3-methyl-5-hydroxy-6-metoxy-1,4-benzoquinol methylase